MPGWAGQRGQGLLRFEQGLKEVRSFSPAGGRPHGGMAGPKPEASVSDE